MRYDLVIEKQLERLTSLKRVRIKVDPKLVASEEDYSKCSSYEGYVLEEGLSKLKVLVLPPDLSITEIPTELIEFLADEHNEDLFADLAIHFIHELNLQEGDPVIQQLMNCSTVDELEQFAIQNGLNVDEISEIYKRFIMS